MIATIIVAIAILIIATISFFALKYNDITKVCMEIEDSIVDIGRISKQGFIVCEKEGNDELEVITEQIVLIKKNPEDASLNEEVTKQRVISVQGTDEKHLHSTLATINKDLDKHMNYYNSLVKKYNKTISTFPTSVAAKIFKFTPL